MNTKYKANLSFKRILLLICCIGFVVAVTKPKPIYADDDPEGHSADLLGAIVDSIEEKGKLGGVLNIPNAVNNEFQKEMVRDIFDNIPTIFNGANGSNNDGAAAFIRDCMAGDFEITYTENGVEKHGIMGGLFQNAYQTMKAVGAILCLAIALGHLFSRMEKGEDPIQCVYKTLIEIGITLLIMMNLGNIIFLLAELGFEILRLFYPLSGSEITDAQVEAFLQSVYGSPTGSSLWRTMVNSMLQGTGATLFNRLVSILANIVIYTTAIEMIIRRMFAPLAIADIYQEGLRSSGARFLKSFFACFIKLAICQFCLSLFPYIEALTMPFVSNDGWGTAQQVARIGIMTAIAIKGSIVYFMFQCGSIAKEIVGA